MSDLFSIYEDNYNTIINRVTKTIETFSNLSRDKTESAIKDADSNLKEAERILSQMELECSANQKTNSQIVVKLRTYKNEYEQTKKRFLKLQDTYIMKKSQEALMTDEIDEQELQEIQGDGKKNNQKSKLIENEALAYKQQQSLEQAKRVALDIEHQSIGIMNNLEHNNEMLKGVNQKVYNLNSNLDNSNSLMTRILKRENRNKLIIVSFSIVVLTIFSVILYNNLK